MKKRTKLFATLLGVIAVVVSALCLVACNDKKEYTYTFVTYDNQSVTVKGTEGGAVKFPTVERDSYAFDGWYVSASFDGEPVVSAKFTSNVTLYAKWTPVYAANLDLDGGSLDGVTDKLYIKLGANIAEFMKDYEPTKGEYKFGGWFVGDVKLPDTAVMTENGINLTARYMAEYTLNAYLQNADLDGYDYKASYHTGYALIDDELDLETLNVKGFEFAEAEGDRSCDIIDADKSKNVFTMHFDRSLYEVVFNANYPDGSTDEHNEWHLYGVEFDLPTDTFTCEGARFLGWAEKADADYTQYIEDGKYTLQSQTTTLYAQWNVGYSDMFMGYDTIFVDPDKQGAVLCRGGVDIAGTYDEDRNYYVFRGDDKDGERVTLRARLTDSHKFIYYDDRSGSYTLYEDGYLNKNITLSIDNLNNVNYYDNTPDYEKIKRGTYTISEENESYYVAEFTDGTSFTFILGMTTDNTPSFRIRGDEYQYGVMAQKGAYYPLLELDGFGNLIFLQGAQYDVEYGAYAIDGNMLVITLLSGPSYTFKLFKYDGAELYNGFELYDADWDTDAEGKRPYTGAMAQIRLDGCSNARYTRSGGSGSTAYYDAKYTYAQSIQGGYILILTQTDGTITKFRLYDAVMGSITIPTFDELDVDYNEYMYADPDGKRAGSPYLIVDGTKGKTYEVNAQNARYLASTGTIEQLADGSIKYTPTKWEVDAQTKFKSMTVRLDTTNTRYNYYYRLSITDLDENTENYGTVYTQKNGTGTLKLVSAFAYYTDSKGKTVIGVYSDYTTFITVTVDLTDYYYFILDKDNNEFEVLAKAPMRLTKREFVPSTGNYKTTNTITLTITGKTNVDGDFETVYVDTETGETYSGYSVETVIELLGVKGVIYTFTSVGNELKFKYYISASSSAAYFIYFAASDEITIATLSEINDDNLSDTTKSLVITDALQDGKNLVLYKDSSHETQGYVVQNGPHYAFDEYMVVTYSFYNFAGVKQFDFTLAGNTMFRKCAEDETFTDKGGATLELDGATHKARYTYSDGVRHLDSDYLVDNSEGMRTIIVLFGETYYFFDIMDEGTNTFEMRGTDSALYILVSNGNIQTAEDPDDGVLIMTVYLDGHGNVTLSYLKEDADETVGTYTRSGDVYTITVDDRTIVGRLGVLAVGDSQYRAFYVRMDNTIAGTYLDKTSLAVLTLDDVGNVVKYDTYGQRIVGSYLRLDDNLFYYVNTTNTDGAMYKINMVSGEIVASDYRKTFYSDGFGSIVFYVNGVALVNNDTSDVTYFSNDGDKLYSYSYAPEAEGNKYGYVKSERFVLKTEKIGEANVNYIELDGVKYYEFDGKYVTFTDKDGATLTFQPTGDATFTVAATYRAKDSDKDVTLFAVVVYNDDGEVETFLATYENRSIAGSRYAYSTFVSWDLALHFVDKSFVYDPNLATFDFLAYDSMYIQTYQMFGSMFYGQLYLVGTEKADGSVDYKVAGQINYITVEVEDESGEAKTVALSFTDGTLEQAGVYNSQYGHIFTTEFTGNDGELYHLNFFMLPSGVYMIYSLTRVTSTIDCGNSNCLYTEEFVNSYFRIPNGKTNAETGEDEFYTKGDEYLPSLKFNGTLVCVSSINGYDSEAVGGVYTWEFMADEYYGTYLQEYAYVLKFTLDDTTGSDVIVPQSLARYSVEGYDEGDNTVVVYEAEDGTINKIYAVYIGSKADLVSSSEYNSADQTYTVTTESGKTYTVKLTKSENENGDEVRAATITEQQESSPEDNA